MSYNRGGAAKEKRRIVFHSELTELGPTRVVVDDNPRYLKNKSRDVVEVTINGEKVLLWLENEECAQPFAEQKGKSFTIVAEGSKDSATIVKVGERIQEAVSEPAAPAQRQVSHPTPHTPNPNRGAPSLDDMTAIRKTKVCVARRLSLKKICVKAMMRFKDEVESNGAPAMPAESFWAQVTNLNISAEAQGLGIRDGFIDALPENLDWATLTPVHKTAPTGTQAAKPAAPPPPPPPVCVACGQELDANGVCDNKSCTQARDDVPF